MTTDLLVLGSGVAGLSAAVRAASAGLRVLVLTKGELGYSATRYAQGGVAAALDSGDSPDLHLADTLGAGGDLCDIDATRVLVTEGPDRVRDLVTAGAVFDRTGDAEAAVYALAREGGHTVARVVHAGGDATGAEIERALVAMVGAAGVELREHWLALDLLVRNGRVTGVRASERDGPPVDIEARHVVLASGGAGQLFAATTNPVLSTGDGTAMALRAGVAVADLEFMQFHPTALYHDAMPRPLLSEALRGDGAVLRDEAGVPFMEGEHPLADLAPRDVVARALARRLIERGLDHLWLDATVIDDFSRRFPTIWRHCRDAGLDPTREWLPVAPAAHYLSGGVVTDLDGAAAPGLWACGEAACTGVHGANRLASNSLLEGLVFAPRVVDAIVAGKDAPEPTGAMRGVSPPELGHLAVSMRGGTDQVRDGDAGASARRSLQFTMTAGAGVVRDAESLHRTAAAIEALAADELPAEERNLVDLGRALVTAALAREESRGCHTRLDFPDTDPRFEGRFVVAGGTTRPEFVARPVPVGP